MAHYTFEPCPECGNDDPSEYTVTHNGEEITADDVFIFFKTPSPDHTAILISCNLCEYSVARSVQMN